MRSVKRAAKAARGKSSRTSSSRRRAAAGRPLEQLERREMLAAHIVGSTVSYATIQAAVNAAAAGAVINVDAGTYDETVTISKSLTLQGANVNVDARTTRNAETIVYATQTVFAVDANDVTINGFTIEGDDANIGAKQGAGVLMAPSIAGTHVLDNIIQSNVTGIYLSNDSNTDQCLIQHNLIQNNFEAGNNWQLAVGENGSRGIYTDGTVSGGYLTNVLIDSNTLYNSNFNGGDEDEGMIALQALTAGKQFNITITNNTIGNESKAILATNVTNLVFMGNTVTNLDDGSSGPVRFEGNANTVDIQYNSIHNNSGPGVAADSSGVPGDSSGFVVDDNDIYSNDGIGVLTIASVYDGTLTAVGDYWGSSNGPSGDGPGSGQAVWANGNSGHGVTPSGAAGGSVVFSPWATSMINIAAIPVPAADAGLSASAASATSTQLSWTPQMSTASMQLVQRSTDGVNFTTVATLPPLLNSFTDTGLSPGTAYTYRVVAANATGDAAASNAAKTTTFAAAGGTVALSTLSWTSATAGYGTVQKNLSILGNPITLAGTVYATGIGTHAASTITYNLAGTYTTFSSTVGIDQEEDGKGAGEVDFQVVGDGKVLYDSGVLTNDQLGHVSVSVAGVQTLELIATNGIANNIDYDHSDWAGATLSVGSILPAAPTGLTAKLSGTTPTLSWTDGGSNQTGFTVQRSTDGVNFTSIATGLAATATTYADTSTLSPSTTYTYRVIATSSVGSSAASNTASVTTAAAGTVIVAVSSMTAVSATTGYGSVMINKSVNGNALTLNGVTYASGIGVNAVSDLVYNLAGQYTTFSSVVGVDDEENAKGTGSVDFQVIGDGKVLFDSGVLHNGGTPVTISVSVSGVQQLTLAAVNGVAGTIDYDQGDWANATLAGTPTAPATPTALAATALTATSVKLTWAESGTNQTAFAIDRSTDDATWTTVSTTVAGTATSWVDPTTLAASTKYYYRIRAVSAAGASANSAVANVTTLAPQTVTNLSSLTPTSATAGYGTVQMNKSILGNPLTLAGTVYATGIGTHAASTIVYNLAGGYNTFVSTVGIDQEEDGKGFGEVDFQVYGDGVLLFDSGVLTNDQTANVAVSVAGVKTLTLVATNGIANDIDYDHADWAGAELLS
jgi:hypothetical protein